MPKINLLSEELINKIAAGEVIERPASVVKELIENSLDAKATKIFIDILDSGKKLIKVSDNGNGMDEEDAKNSILRHATSKITKEEDLFAINTLGFRGEALASISAVSQLSIITKPESTLEGFNLVVEAGNIVSSGIMAAETGTTIEVRNLFFNTPARKKFLKTDTVELRHIIDIITRYSLINPHVYFRLRHEGYILINAPSVDNLQSKISFIYGTNLAKDMLDVHYSTEDVTITGFIAKPHQCRNDRSQQSIYVNGRWIKNEDLTTAIYNAFHSLLFVNKHPVAVLDLRINPEKIDVNVHPHKTEIKIEQKDLISKALFTAIKETLQKNNLIPTLDMETEQQLAFGTPLMEVKKGKYPLEKSIQSHLSAGVIPEKEMEYNNAVSTHSPLANDHLFSQKQASDSYSNSVSTGFTTRAPPLAIPQSDIYSKLPPMKILGQLHKTFFIAEIDGGVLFIDQHVVQERVLYERFMEQYLNKQVALQTLLQSEIMEFTSIERVALLENKNLLEGLGFCLEEFGGNSFLLKTIPTVLGRTQHKVLLYDVLSYLLEGKNKMEDIQEEIITRMACRASIKAGDEVTISEIQTLLQELTQTKLPYTCPHGRSVLIKVDFEELEKKFKRK
ncbi:DNA mismatch repair endonuclease MutL [Candidatus Woesearchaeota archaeon]|nr:DNA mismatch repair endonuclease MutL [Candidatus Woesearchaeota archaeon]